MIAYNTIEAQKWISSTIPFQRDIICLKRRSHMSNGGWHGICLYHGGQHGKPTSGKHKFCIRASIDVIFALLKRSWKMVQNIAGKVFTQKSVVWCFKMSLKSFKPQFSKMGLAIKMTMQIDSSKILYYEIIKIDEKNIMIQYGSLIKWYHMFWVFSLN